MVNKRYQPYTDTDDVQCMLLQRHINAYCFCGIYVLAWSCYTQLLFILFQQ